MIETWPIENIDDVLAKTNKGKESNKAKIFSNVARDETGVRIAKVAIPMDDVTKKMWLLPWIIRLLRLPLDKQQRHRSLIRVINARLDREIQKKNMYKEENMKLKEYIAGMRCEDPTFLLPIAVDHGFHFAHDATRNTHAEFGKWIEDVTK